MKDRIATILSLVTSQTKWGVDSARPKKSVFPGIGGFTDAGEDAFILQTNYSDYGQQTRLEFEEGYVFFIRLIHFFGIFHPQQLPSSQQLIDLLIRNGKSDSHVGAKLIDGTYYATLHSTGYYHEEETDENLAELFQTQLNRVIMDLIIDLPKMIRQLGVHPFQPYFGPEGDEVAKIFGPVSRKETA